MNWQDLRFSINLDTPPQIFMLGHSWHGTVPIERYRFPTIWCLHLYPYEAEVIVDNVLLPIRPGHVGITAPSTSIEYRYTTQGPHLYAHFAVPPSDDGIMIRAMQDASSSFDRLYQSFEMAIACGQDHPHRAKSLIWQILWEIAFLDKELRTERSKTTIGQYVAVTAQLGLVRLAVEHIEERIGEPMTVRGLADELGVSHNHLTRQFRAQTGSTVIGFIQKRRMERARILLIGSARSLTSIAAEVGIPDVQQFNKTVRKLLGASPSGVRAAGRKELQ